MVDVTLTDLVAEGNDIAVLVPERRTHEIVAEIAADGFGVLRLPGGFIGIPEFVVAPRNGGTGIRLRQTEFHMVAGVMKAARNIHKPVPIGVKHGLVLLDESGREIGAVLLLVHRLQRHLGIVGMAVTTPGQEVVLGNIGTAHIRIVEIHGILQELRPIRIDLVVIGLIRGRLGCGRHRRQCRHKRHSAKERRSDLSDLHPHRPFRPPDAEGIALIPLLYTISPQIASLPCGAVKWDLPCVLIDIPRALCYNGTIAEVAT